jgi:hypothetical protein
MKTVAVRYVNFAGLTPPPFNVRRKIVLLTCEPSCDFVYELVVETVSDAYDTIVCLCLLNKRGNVRVTWLVCTICVPPILDTQPNIISLEFLSPAFLVLLLG